MIATRAYTYLPRDRLNCSRFKSATKKGPRVVWFLMGNECPVLVCLCNLGAIEWANRWESLQNQPVEHGIYINFLSSSGSLGTKVRRVTWSSSVVKGNTPLACLSWRPEPIFFSGGGRCQGRLVVRWSWRFIVLMEEIRLTSWYGKYTIIHSISYILGGAGFQPSTVSPVFGSDGYLSKGGRTERNKTCAFWKDTIRGGCFQWGLVCLWAVMNIWWLRLPEKNN